MCIAPHAQDACLELVCYLSESVHRLVVRQDDAGLQTSHVIDEDLAAIQAHGKPPGDEPHEVDMKREALLKIHHGNPLAICPHHLPAGNLVEDRENL